MHWQTHTVFNQPIPLNNSNLYLSDGALCEAVTREGAGWDSDFLASIGQQLGTAESLELGRLANVNPPELLRYDAQGRRLDDVRFHPAWHLLMQALCTNRVHNLAWEEDARSGAFVARFLPDGQRNAIRLERLKDKLGNRSNASCEVEFQDAIGWLLGQEGEGIRLILKMGGMTRFDCALGSHAMMRRAFSLAIYHAHQRHVFGNPLIQQPLMRHVLSRMALQLEGQTALLFRLARAWDRRADAKEALWARLFTPAAKFVICKRGMPFVAEAMEVLGGIGYCEESELPRLYREMPVNSIWEGSGNIMCLDVLRVLNKQAGVYDLLSEAFVEVKGQDRYFDRAVRRLQQQLRKPAEELGREITHQLFLLGCGAQMLKYASPPMAQAWCQVMLDTRGGVRLSEQIQNDLLLRATGGVCV
ncbi:isovaleryl-CoA dehydrogenase [Escherichia coli]|nr:isovaleryl-CoA dehydrogenase [Escherichia coli]EHW1207960.1 isovaleryl-CoA dehydrogenase [Escherichia coli]EHX1042836.1 isovaleryl-CoA dehydrogenase [Escherichia coli]